MNMNVEDLLRNILGQYTSEEFPRATVSFEGYVSGDLDLEYKNGVKYPTMSRTRFLQLIQPGAGISVRTYYKDSGVVRKRIFGIFTRNGKAMQLSQEDNLEAQHGLDNPESDVDYM